jgi:protein-tyrosine-phosphatase
MADLPSAVLFACNMNSIRSPMAEGILKFLHGNRIYVDSVGVRKMALSPAVESGLQWLCNRQGEAGGWESDGFRERPSRAPSISETGFALLAMLAHGNSVRFGPRRQQVKQGVKFLRRHQKSGGRFVDAGSHRPMFDHAVSAYAMIEAFGLSNYKTLRRNAQGGVDYLFARQRKDGGWGESKCASDLRTTTWCILALRSAAEFKLQVDNAVFARALRCVETFRHERDTGDAFTAMRLLSLSRTNSGSSWTEGMRRVAAVLSSRPPVWNDHEYWFFATFALIDAGPPHLEGWTKQLVVANEWGQRRDGCFTGSWDPNGGLQSRGGRVRVTAMMLIALGAHKRFTRLAR